MLKSLVKKQISDVGSFMFYDSKKGKRRTKGGIIGYSFLMGWLYLFMCICFSGVAEMMCGPLFEVGLDWMYYGTMGSASVFMGVFGGVFSTFSSVYLAKDNELLLSMPIKKGDIIIARLSGVWLLGFIYMSIVYLPTVVIAWTEGGFSFGTLIAQIIMLPVLSMIVLVLSAVLGWVVAEISKRLHGRAFVTVLISILLMAVYYVACFRLSDGIENFVGNSVSIADSFKRSGFLLYHLGLAMSGNFLFVLLQLAASAALILAVYLVLNRTFVNIVTTNRGEKKTVYRENRAVSNTSDKALFNKELKRFTSSSTYMLNSGIGVVMIVVAAVMIFIKRDSIVTAIYGMGLSEDTVTAIIIAAVCYLSTLNEVSAPSISLEGKNLWILQVAPVSSWQVLKAKLKLHVAIALPPVVILCISAMLSFDLDIMNLILMLLLSCVFVLLSGAYGLVLGLKFPNLNWTSEAAAVKQNTGMMITMFGSWGLLLILGVIGFFGVYKNIFDITLYLTIVLVAVYIVYRLVIGWLKKKGSKILESL